MEELTREDAGEGGGVWRLIGSVSLIAGGILILTSAVFPSPVDPGEFSEHLRLMVENRETTQVVLLTVPIGILAFTIGIMSVQKLLSTPGGAAFTEIASYTLLIGAGVVIVQFGLGNAALAEAVRSDLQTGATLWAGATHVRSFGMLIIWTALVILGFGLLREPKFNRLLSWPPLLLGIGMISATIPAILTGPQKPTAIASGAIAALTAIWAIALGTQVRRLTSSRLSP